eukprot:COSAG01_NODE_1691_length_9480_cov_5.430231_11_plen_102_part_00
METRFSVVMIQSLVSLFEASMMVLDCITHRHNCSTVGSCLLTLYLDLDGRPRDDVLVPATHDRAILPPRGGTRGGANTFGADHTSQNGTRLRTRRRAHAQT